jgi:hypothetical protein
MFTIRRRWTVAAGIVLGATAASQAMAQDKVGLPASPPAAVAPAPVEKTEPSAEPRSPYHPVAAVTNPSSAESMAPEVVPSAKGASPALDGPSIPTSPVPANPVGYSNQANWIPAPPVDRPSFWRRLKTTLQPHFLGYPAEFEAPPLGHFVYLHAKTQVANGDAARMVLYHYDFDGTQLSTRGEYQLEKIAAMLPRNFFPIVIEADPQRPGRDEARRVAVLQALGRGPFPVPPERVLVGRPIAGGLNGVEAERIYNNLIRQTDAQGRTGVTGITGASAAVAPGGAPAGGGGAPTGPP